MSDLKGKGKELEVPEFDDLEFEKLLNSEASLLSREQEVRQLIISSHLFSLFWLTLDLEDFR